MFSIRKIRRSHPARRFVPTLEPLEGRLVPSAAAWTGLPDQFLAPALTSTEGQLALYASSPSGAQGWENVSNTWGGTLQGSNSRYSEGATIPFRFVGAGQAAGSTHTLTIQYDFANSQGVHFIDALGSYKQNIAADPTLNVSGLGRPSTWAIPTDPSLAAGIQIPGFFTAYNVSSLNVSGYSTISGGGSASVKQITLTYTVDPTGGGTKDVVIAFGGHLANGNNWGAGMGAADFPGGSGKVYTSLDGAAFSQASVNPNQAVADHAPLLSTPAAVTIPEGQTATNTGTFSDPDGDAVTLSASVGTVTWSGSSNGFWTWSYAATDGPLQSQTVTITANDGHGGISTATFQLTVNNVAPTANLSNDGPVNEGGAATVSFDGASDPSSKDAAAGFHYSFALDQSALAGSYGAASSAASAQFTFADNGSYIVYGRIFDKDGGYTDYQTTVVVNNVAPTGILSNSGPVSPGSAVTVSFGGVHDPSSVDTADGFRYSFALDQSALAGSYAAAGAWASAQFTWAASGNYVVYGRIFDKDGGYTDYSTVVIVTNLPFVNAGPDQLIDEGSTFGNSGFFTDSGNGPWTATVDYGDGSGVQQLILNPDKTFTLSHAYADNGVYTVTVTVSCGSGNDDGVILTMSDTLKVSVINVAPTADLSNDGPVSEGGTVTVSFGGAFDPSSVDTKDGFHYSFALDPSALAGSYDTAGSAASAQFNFADNGTYMVWGRIFDKDGGYTDYQTTVVVNNVAPTADLSNDGPVNEGGTATVSFGGVYDPSSVDSAAGFHYSFALDPSGLAGNYAEAGSAASAQFTFADNGSYTVYGRVFDKDGGYTDYSTVVTVANSPTEPADPNAGGDGGTNSSAGDGSDGGSNGGTNGGSETGGYDGSDTGANGNSDGGAIGGSDGGTNGGSGGGVNNAPTDTTGPTVPTEPTDTTVPTNPSEPRATQVPPLASGSNNLVEGGLMTQPNAVEGGQLPNLSGAVSTRDLPFLPQQADAPLASGVNSLVLDAPMGPLNTVETTQVPVLSSGTTVRDLVFLPQYLAAEGARLRLADSGCGGQLELAGPDSGNQQSLADDGGTDQSESADVQGVVFGDCNGDGVWSEGEPRLSGVTVRLVNETGSVMAVTLTGPEGDYCFSKVPAGRYRVEVDPCPEWEGAVSQAFTVSTGTVTVDPLSMLPSGEDAAEGPLLADRGASSAMEPAAPTGLKAADAVWVLLAAALPAFRNRKNRRSATTAAVRRWRLLPPVA
jgi:hypothetical protein